MKNKTAPNPTSTTRGKSDAKPALPGYPAYPPAEDIYNASKEAKNVDPENPAAKKAREDIGITGKNNEKSFVEDLSGADLDVPGSELDDEQESVGSEDEENNYYSIGGDDHDNLEEDQGQNPDGISLIADER